jgi:hypothetical protein
MAAAQLSDCDIDRAVRMLVGAIDAYRKEQK